MTDSCSVTVRNRGSGSRQTSDNAGSRAAEILRFPLHLPDDNAAPVSNRVATREVRRTVSLPNSWGQSRKSTVRDAAGCRPTHSLKVAPAKTHVAEWTRTSRRSESRGQRGFSTARDAAGCRKNHNPVSEISRFPLRNRNAPKKLATPNAIGQNGPGCVAPLLPLISSPVNVSW